VLQLYYWITIRNSAEFIESPRRTPTAAINSMLHRGIEGGPIDAGLSARNDLHNLIAMLLPSRAGLSRSLHTGPSIKMLGYLHP
jgi:hypothetical protein